MQFSWLEGACGRWDKVLVIGRSFEREGRRYHIIGMTLGEKASIYLIEPYVEEVQSKRRKNASQRARLKEFDRQEDTYLHCSEFRIGSKTLTVQGGQGGSLKYSENNYEELKLFFDMMNAGWEVPGWLREEEWENLQLVRLTFADVKRLPKYTPDMPIVIKHEPVPIEHLLEKTVTLKIGGARSFQFTDDCGEHVQCYINDVMLVDVWDEEQFNHPKYKERFSEEEMQQIKEQYYTALKESCPEGMCYIGIEYECSKDVSLQFYAKDYLKSCPQTHSSGSASFLLVNWKPEKKTGTHGFPLKGAAINYPFLPDTEVIPAEVFSYIEMKEPWEESI